VGPGCRRASSSVDLDHRRRHADHGRTDEPNLNPLCRHEHRNKDERGWQLRKIGETSYEWTSPLGRRHIVDVPSVAAPLPSPMPRELPGELADDWEPLDLPTFEPVDPRGRSISSASGTDTREATPRPPPEPPPY
jgi:hypothetical protein